MARNRVPQGVNLAEFNAESLRAPKEYEGREQTWIKHCVLKAYLVAWANKLGSVSRQRRVRLWYVDTFAGPWRSLGSDLQDTSIAIGLRVIQEAAVFWQKQGLPIELDAIFIEKDQSAFKDLQTYLAAQQLPFQPKAFLGTFGENVDVIDRLIGDDPAFCFVDPTGWKGADMKFIKRLVSKPRRDVLINFMYDYVNRFKDHREGSQHDEMASFFGAEIPEGLPEEDLMMFYRQQLVRTCSIKYAADLIVQDPCRDRTKFRMVVGGNHIEVLKLFRDVEKKIVHREQPIVRLVAKENKEIERTGQLPLLSALDSCDTEQPEKALLRLGENQVLEMLPKLFKKTGATTFEILYPEILQECHITYVDLKKLIWRLRADKKIVLDNLQVGQKSVKDFNMVTHVAADLKEAEKKALQLSFNI